jgi:hypothetical protein
LTAPSSAAAAKPLFRLAAVHQIRPTFVVSRLSCNFLDPAKIKGLRFAEDMHETHPEKRLLGYARVSTYGQTLDSQLEQLRKAGCASRNIYREKVTGARADRRELNRMLGKLGPGDTVTVTQIDRLARSTFDIFAIVKRIVDAKAQFRSLAEPWADTGTSTGRLMLAVLGGLADVGRRRQEPRQGPRKGHGSTFFPDTGTEEGGHQAARAGRYPRGISPELQRQPRDDFTARNWPVP